MIAADSDSTFDGSRAFVCVFDTNVRDSRGDCMDRTVCCGDVCCLLALNAQLAGKYFVPIMETVDAVL